MIKDRFQQLKTKKRQIFFKYELEGKIMKELVGHQQKYGDT